MSFNAAYSITGGPLQLFVVWTIPSPRSVDVSSLRSDRGRSPLDITVSPQSDCYQYDDLVTRKLLSRNGESQPLVSITSIGCVCDILGVRRLVSTPSPVLGLLRCDLMITSTPPSTRAWLGINICVYGHCSLRKDSNLHGVNPPNDRQPECSQTWLFLVAAYSNSATPHALSLPRI